MAPALSTSTSSLRLGLEDLRRRGADGGERTRVHHHDREAILAVSRHESVAHCPEPLRAAAREDHPRAERCQLFRGGPAQAGRGAGDERRSTGERIRTRLGPGEEPPPQLESDTAETTYDRNLGTGVKI